MNLIIIIRKVLDINILIKEINGNGRIDEDNRQGEEQKPNEC
jgi:hypothetical protein